MKIAQSLLVFMEHVWMESITTLANVPLDSLAEIANSKFPNVLQRILAEMEEAVLMRKDLSRVFALKA